MERLQKVIAQAGIASRRKAEEMIAQGRVCVNGDIITEMGYKVKRGDVVEVDGNPIEKENKVGTGPSASPDGPVLLFCAAPKAFPPQGGRCHGICRDG